LTLLPAAFAQPQPKPGAAASGEHVVGGEHLVKRVISDNQQGGIPAVTIYLPESWRLEGKIEWNYGWTETPVAFSAKAENPANAEAYFCYPLFRADYIEVPPNLQAYARKNMPKPGERWAMGAFNLAPHKPGEALAMYVKKVRGNEPKFQWVGRKALPNLAKALGLAPWPGQVGGAIKISYELNGQPVEEAFFAVYYISQVPGQLPQTNWGLQAVQSFRAPAGTLEKRLEVFAAMAKTMCPTPEWSARSNVINARLKQMFQQKLKQGYDDIRAAEAVRNQMVKTMGDSGGYPAFLRDSGNEGYPGFLRDGGGSSDVTGGRRSAGDGWDAGIRGVDVVKEGNGTTERPYADGDYHWGNGFGDHLDLKDPNEDPNGHEPGTWERLPEVH
jgi:hypothetical protein